MFMSGKGPFIGIVLAVLTVVIGIELAATVVEETDTALDSATSGGNFDLSGTVLQFVPVVYIAAVMGIAGSIGFASAGRVQSGDRFTAMILTVLVVVIGISLTGTVLDAATNVITALDSATNDMALARTILPFLPVVYVAALLGLAGITGFRALRG